MLHILARRVKNDRKFLSVIAITFLTRGLMSFGALGLNLVLARTLGTSGLGLFMLGMSVILGLGVLARFGLDSALLQFNCIAYGDLNLARLHGIRLQSIIIGGISSVV